MAPEGEMTRAAQVGGHVRTRSRIHPIAKSLRRIKYSRRVAMQKTIRLKPLFSRNLTLRMSRAIWQFGFVNSYRNNPIRLEFFRAP
jgi:hypothetical protein